MMTILSAWLLADFLSGIGHWYEDKMLKPHWYGFLDNIQKDNELHHNNPTFMLRNSWLDNISTTCVITLPLTAILFGVGAPTVLTLGVFFASFANLIHRFSHTPKFKRPRLVRFLQATGLFCSADQHLRHHFDSNGLIKKENSQLCYCPMTSWLNPILDKMRFFAMLERLRG